MKLNVQYIPLEKIKPNFTIKLTEHVKKLRGMMWDCMNMLVVKKDKNGGFTIISGNDRYEYLTKHTKHKYAPCIIDEYPIKTDIKYWLNRLRRPEKMEKENNDWLSRDKMCPTAISIVRAFFKEDTRFKKLSHIQRLKVILLAVRYKKTVIGSMKTKVEDILDKSAVK